MSFFIKKPNASYVNKKNNHSSLFLSAALLTSLLSACGSDNDDKAETPVMAEFEIIVKNLTNAQPASPLAIAFHDGGSLWQIGSAASDALELLAESGDNSELLAATMISAGFSGEGVILPGMSETNVITIDESYAQELSIVTMLVNTNDAFTGVSSLDVSNLAINESISLYTRSYDAGTEGNSELMSTIPGPASGGEGEGYNSSRDDVDFVAMHSGVVSKDDGKTQSVLTQAHRFDNPVLAISITRIK